MNEEQIIARLKILVRIEKRASRDILMLLYDLDRRRFFVREAFAISEYCIEELGMDERSAARRAKTIGMMKRFPACVDALLDDDVNMSTLELLEQVMTDENAEELLKAVAGMTEAQVKFFLMRDMGVELKAKLILRIGRAFQMKLERLRSLMSHVIPGGDVVELLEECMDRRIEQLERQRWGAERPAPTGEKAAGEGSAAAPGPAAEEKPVATESPAAEPVVADTLAAQVTHVVHAFGRRQHVPAAVERAVWKRDGYRCTYASPSGRRCRSTTRLQLHHKHPDARGGPPTVENLTVRCQRHNDYAAEQDFGREFMERKKRERGGRRRQE